MKHWLKRLAPVACLATGACLATRSDVQVLQNDLAIMRAEAAEREQGQRAKIDSLLDALAVIQVVNDSVRAANVRMARFQTDVREELYALNQQLLTVQELTGQSQRRLQELRASVEQRNVEAQRAQVEPAMGRDTSRAPAPTTPPPPGPNTLLQLGIDQMRRGSHSAARRAFEDLLAQYPTADVAPDALYWTATTYSEEGNTAAADSVFTLVVQRFPQSSRAPTALYRRARIQLDRNNPAAAKTMLEQVVRQWPRSDEAELARDILRTLR